MSALSCPRGCGVMMKRGMTETGQVCPQCKYYKGDPHWDMGEERVMKCTEDCADWCPNCGDCTCPRDSEGYRIRFAVLCPLHGRKSRHNEEPTTNAAACRHPRASPPDD